MGIPPQTTFEVNHEESQALHTLFTQEMLNRGFLATKAVSVSYSHTEGHVAKYMKNVDEAFGVMKEAIDKNKIHSFLKGPIARVGFKRLT